MDIRKLSPDIEITSTTRRNPYHKDSVLTILCFLALLLASCSVSFDPGFPATTAIQPPANTAAAPETPASTVPGPAPTVQLVPTPAPDADPALEDAPAQPGDAQVLAAGLPAQYIPQPGTPIGIPDFLHPQFPCGWAGIGGQIFGLEGAPVVGLIVEVSGTVQGTQFKKPAISGSSPAFGPGGYEIKLADAPVATQGTLRLRVFDIDGAPLSEPLLFDTYGECERSLLLFNLVAVPAGTTQYLPFISRTQYTYRYFPIVIMTRR